MTNEEINIINYFKNNPFVNSGKILMVFFNEDIHEHMCLIDYGDTLEYFSIHLITSLTTKSVVNIEPPIDKRIVCFTKNDKLIYRGTLLYRSEDGRIVTLNDNGKYSTWDNPKWEYDNTECNLDIINNL